MAPGQRVFRKRWLKAPTVHNRIKIVSYDSTNHKTAPKLRFDKPQDCTKITFHKPQDCTKITILQTTRLHEIFPEQQHAAVWKCWMCVCDFDSFLLPVALKKPLAPTLSAIVFIDGALHVSLFGYHLSGIFLTRVLGPLAHRNRISSTF